MLMCDTGQSWQIVEHIKEEYKRSKMLFQVVYMIVLPWRTGALFFFLLSLNIEYSKRLCNNITIEDRR